MRWLKPLLPVFATVSRCVAFIYLNEMYNHFFFVHPFLVLLLFAALSSALGFSVFLEGFHPGGLSSAGAPFGPRLELRWQSLALLLAWTGSFFFNSPLQNELGILLAKWATRLVKQDGGLCLSFYLAGGVMVAFLYVLGSLGRDSVVGPGRYFGRDEVGVLAVVFFALHVALMLMVECRKPSPLWEEIAGTSPEASSEAHLRRGSLVDVEMGRIKTLEGAYDHSTGNAEDENMGGSYEPQQESEPVSELSYSKFDKREGMRLSSFSCPRVPTVVQCLCFSASCLAGTELRPDIALNVWDFDWCDRSRNMAVITACILLLWVGLEVKKIKYLGNLNTTMQNYVKVLLRPELLSVVSLVVFAIYDCVREQLSAPLFLTLSAIGALSVFLCMSIHEEWKAGEVKKPAEVKASTSASFATCRRQCLRAARVFSIGLALVLPGVSRFVVHRSAPSIDSAPWALWEGEMPLPKHRREFQEELVLVSNSFLSGSDWMMTHAGSLKEAGVETLVYDRLAESADHWCPSVGREALFMALYVWQYYESLPEWTIFAHGHRRSYHQGYDLLEVVSNRTWMRPDAKVHVLSIFYRSDIPLAYQGRRPWDLNQAVVARKAWGRLFPDEAPPVALDFAHYAQFMVHKSVLRRRSREWWERLYRLVLSPETRSWPFKDWHSGYMLELLWLYVFKESFDEVGWLPRSVAEIELPPYQGEYNEF